MCIDDQPEKNAGAFFAFHQEAATAIIRSIAARPGYLRNTRM
jgi:hypothetical protein